MNVTRRETQQCPNCNTELIDNSGALPVYTCPSCKATAHAATGGHFIIKRPPDYTDSNTTPNERNPVIRWECVVCGLEVEGRMAECQFQKYSCQDVLSGDVPGGAP